MSLRKISEILKKYVNAAETSFGIYIGLILLNLVIIINNTIFERPSTLISVPQILLFISIIYMGYSIAEKFKLKDVIIAGIILGPLYPLGMFISLVACELVISLSRPIHENLLGIIIALVMVIIYGMIVGAILTSIGGLIQIKIKPLFKNKSKK